MQKPISLLIIIVILGLLLRFIGLTYNPPSLNWDEVSHGYNAYSVLKTGMDEWGQKLPLFNFRAYGDYPTPLNLYLTIPFIVLFGLTDFAIRFPHALLGTLTIVSVYFFAFGITKRTNVSLLAAFLTAIGPWYLFTSRFVLQSNLSVFLLTTAAALFANRERHKYFLPVSLFLLFLTLFSYHTTRIFSPLMLLAMIFIHRHEISEGLKSKKIYSILLAVFAGLFIILSAFILKTPESRARSGLLFVVDQGAVNRIIEKRISSNLPQFAERILYNRPIYFITQFTKNYISYFSPKFLFFQGGTQYQFSVPDCGLIYPVSLPFFYIGLLFVLTRVLLHKEYRMLFAWMVLSPIPASLTNESFAVLRATTMLPLPEIFIALGFYWVISKLPKKLILLFFVAYIALLFVFAEGYLTNYFAHYRTDYSWSWQYGYKEAVDYAEENYSEYDNIIVTKKYGEPHGYFLFFLNWDPVKYQSDPVKITYTQSDWWWVDRFDKFWFVNDWQVKLNPSELSGIQQIFVTESKRVVECGNKKCLLITSPGNFPPGWNKLKTINFLDGKPAFEIYDNK
jgi:4-amino-4-deoxy-L-arabinose transferase-like glycosyltransferase